MTDPAASHKVLCSCGGREGRIRLEKLKMETIFRKRKEMGTSRKAET